MCRPSMTTEVPAVHLGIVHLSIGVGSMEKVDYYTQMIQNDGYEIISQPRTTGDGRYESCILDPDGNYIEITE